MPGTAGLWRRPPAQWQAPAAQRSNQAQRTLVMTTFGSRADGLRLERMRASPRWAGDGFRNRHPITPGLRDSALVMPSTVDFLCAGQRRVGSGRLPVAHPLVAWRLPPETGLRATWLGQSTVLVELDGLRVLTDPVWGPVASPWRLAGPRRFQPVPVALNALLGGGVFLPVYWGTVSLALHAGVNRCSRRGWPLCCRGGARWTAPPRRPAALPRQPPP